MTYGGGAILGALVTVSGHGQPSRLVVADIGHIYAATGANHFPNGNAPATREEFAKRVDRSTSSVRSMVEAWDKPKGSELTLAWIDAIVSHPITYLSFRTERMKLQLGLGGRKSQRGSALKFGFWSSAPNKHNIHIVPNRMNKLHRDYIDYFKTTAVIRTWPWVALVILTSLYCAVRLAWRDSDVDKVRLYLGVSAMLYILPYFVIAPAASYRYVFWPIVVATVVLTSYFAQWLHNAARCMRAVAGLRAL